MASTSSALPFDRLTANGCRGKAIETEALCQGAEMLTHHALEMLKRRTGLTKTR